MKNSATANAVYKRQSEYGKLAFKKDNLMPRRYVFVLTNLCNLACTFCFQERKKQKGAMTKDDWIKLTEQLPKYARVTLTGGEPIVFKGFREKSSKNQSLRGKKKLKSIFQISY